jgi:hypothetical protein
MLKKPSIMIVDDEAHSLAGGTKETAPADALFVLIGAKPHTECGR